MFLIWSDECVVSKYMCIWKRNNQILINSDLKRVFPKRMSFWNYCMQIWKVNFEQRLTFFDSKKVNAWMVDFFSKPDYQLLIFLLSLISGSMSIAENQQLSSSFGRIRRGGRPQGQHLQDAVLLRPRRSRRHGSQLLPRVRHSTSSRLVPENYWSEDNPSFCN